LLLKRGKAEQRIKEGEQAVKMARLSCHRFREIIVEGTRTGRAVAQETMAEVRTAMKISYKR
jgi:hypothetical protein